MSAFKILDLECTKLNDFEKWYLFTSNLQTLAQEELRRKKAQALTNAILVANGLMDHVQSNRDERSDQSDNQFHPNEENRIDHSTMASQRGKK